MTALNAFLSAIGFLSVFLILSTLALIIAGQGKKWAWILYWIGVWFTLISELRHLSGNYPIGQVGLEAILFIPSALLFAIWITKRIKKAKAEQDEGARWAETTNSDSTPDKAVAQLDNQETEASAEKKAHFENSTHKEPVYKENNNHEEPAHKENNSFEEANSTLPVSPEDDKLMISQLVALYKKTGREEYRNQYIKELEKMGFSEMQAAKLFEWESSILQKFNKDYLIDPKFIKMWFMSGSQPFLLNYPKTKEDIQKERFFTISELCKFIDEAEWHYWNSHERASDEAFAEMYTWRLRGEGAEFAGGYFETIAKETEIPEELIWKYVNREGTRLNAHKWSGS